MITPTFAEKAVLKPEEASQTESHWDHVREHLLSQKAQINQAIREYPLPITACDDQFNYLLEKRAKITQELGRLNRLCNENWAGSEGDNELDGFIASSQFIDEKSFISFKVG